MRVPRRLTVLVGALAVSLSLGTALGATTTSARYVGGLPPGGFLPLSGPSYTLPDHPNIGGAWMSVPGGSSLMDVTVSDDMSEVVAADVLFLIDSYAPLIPGPTFCGSAAGIAIPTGSIALYVRVLDVESLGCDPPGVPTRGSITATFR